MEINRTGQRQGTDMKIIAILVSCLVFTCNVYAAPPDVVLVGHFSNLEITHDEDPHFLSGYSLSLYRTGNVVFGNIHAGIGSSETVHGTLYDVTFDERKKTLFFKAKYSEGWESSKEIGIGGRASRVFLSFSGQIASNSLRGTFNKKDGYNLSASGRNISAVMKNTNDDYVEKSFESWKIFQDSSMLDW